MRYEGAIYRPPSEGSSIIIQATVGCPHNQCRFCPMYKTEKFKIRKLAEILEDIKTAGQIYDTRQAHNIFLADGNTIIMRTEQLLRILEQIKEVFPFVQRVTSYGAAQYLSLKTAQEWTALAKAGLNRIHCGLESGYDPLLKLVNKGAAMLQQVQGGRLLKQAGIEVSMYYMAGLGGMEMWQEHAIYSAKVLTEIDPEFIRIRTFAPMENTPMAEEYLTGQNMLMTAHEVLRELDLLLDNLQSNSLILSDHWLNFINLQGRLPQDKNPMRAQIKQALSLPESSFRPLGLIPAQG